MPGGLATGPVAAPKRSTPVRKADCTLGKHETGEVVPDQERDRLTEIKRRLAARAEQIAGVEGRHRDAGFDEIFGEHHPIGRQLGIEHGEVEPLEDMARIGCLEEERVSSLVRNGMSCARKSAA